MIQNESLTYQWLTPLLISMIVALISIIGVMLKGYLNSFEESIDKIGNTLENNILRVEKFMREISDKHVEVDKRVIRLEEHIKNRE